MKVRVKARTSFAHGRDVLHAGQEGGFTKGDAEELQKNGLVDIVTVEGGESQEHQDDDDLLGEKMEPAPKNKMAKPTANKARE